MLPAYCPGFFDRETPSFHAFAPSPLSHGPSRCLSPSTPILSFLPSSSQTIRCKNLVKWGVHCGFNGVAPPFGCSSRPSHPLSPFLRHRLCTKSPSIPSLRHRHPAIASTVLQHVGSFISFFYQIGGGMGDDILGGVRLSAETLGGFRPTQQQILGRGSTLDLAWQRQQPSALATQPLSILEANMGYVGILGSIL